MDTEQLYMEVWAWLGAYLVGFALLQFYLYRHFISGRSTGGESASDRTTPQQQAARDTSAAAGPDAPEGEYVNCSECNTPNEFDPAFTFCKECGARL